MCRHPNPCLFPFLCAAAVTGCGPAVQVDVECPKLCLAAPGPTLPGLASLMPFAPDGAVPAASLVLDAGELPSAADPGLLQNAITWSSAMRFNEVLRQLPNAAIDTSLDVRLGSINVASTTGLSFVDSVRVSLSRDWKPLSGDHAATAEADAGAAEAVAIGGPGCNTAGSRFLVARYDRETDGISGNTIALVNLAAEMNLFDCMKDAPALFSVSMAFQPGSYPDVDAPLTLSTCVGAQGHASYP